MQDLISRQAAIDALGERPSVYFGTAYEIAQRNQYDLDRLAIETVPSAQPETLTVTRDHLLTKDECDRLKQAMRETPILLFPPAQPVRKKGKWTKENACEFCGFQPWFERDIHTLSFCPNCGADLREEGGE